MKSRESTLFFCEQVTADSPAQACGLLAGDVVLSVAGKDISSAAQKAASDVIFKAGHSFPLIIKR